MQIFEKKSNCCGCSLCAEKCPTKAIIMKEDEEGFLYPLLDEKKCISCKLCFNICDFRTPKRKNTHNKKPLILAGKHKADDIRKKTTSGGIFAAFCTQIINEGGVVYGAAFDEKFAVIHGKAETLRECQEFFGSKYCQSNTCDIFEEIQKELCNGKTVLFSGVPCQVAAVAKGFLPQNKESLYLVDIICHGVPSPKLWKEYIDFIENSNKKKIMKITMRDKSVGWRGFNTRITFDDGEYVSNTREAKIFEYLFSSNLCLRPSCYECRYVEFNNQSDISIGDFWGIENICPEFEDKGGVSLIMVHTDKGRKLLEKTNKQIETISVGTDIKLQHNVYYPTKKPENREVFWNEYYKGGFRKLARKYTIYGNLLYIKSLLHKAKTFVLNILFK